MFLNANDVIYEIGGQKLYWIASNPNKTQKELLKLKTMFDIDLKFNKLGQ